MHAYPPAWPSVQHQLIGTAAEAPLVIGLWLWMAWANGRGRSWARIVAAVFFGINTLDLIVSFARVHAVGSLIVSILVWLVGLGAIVFLFSKESGAYFAAQRPARR